MANQNEGLPCEFCGEKLKRLQLDRTDEGVNVRINWHWTRAEVVKQLKGLTSLIKSMAGI